MSTPSRPFSNDPAQLHVLEIGNMIGGPWAATLLGDFGAEVVKVESPGRGDTNRYVKGGPSGYSQRWQIEARNKRSITLDVAVPEGKAIFERLARWADVLVENHRPGVMERRGLGYAQLHEVNPRLVYVSVSGFGQTGPLRDQPGYDFTAAAFSGFTYTIGFADRPPVLPAYNVADYTSGMFAALGALEAVRRRDAPGGTGVGEWVELGLYEPLLRMSANLIAAYEDDGVVLEREGSFPLDDGPAQSPIAYAYETSDGHYLSVSAIADREYRGLAALLEAPELLEPHLLPIEARWTHAATLDRVLRPWIAARTRAEALAALVGAGVACHADQQRRRPQHGRARWRPRQHRADAERAGRRDRDGRRGSAFRDPSRPRPVGRRGARCVEPRRVLRPPRHE